MKRLLLFFLIFTAVQPSLTVAASEFWPSQQFRVPEQLGPVQRTGGKKLAPQLIENAGTAAIKVLAAYLNQQIIDLKKAATVTRDYQSAKNLYTNISSIYALIKAQPEGSFLIERLRIEMGYELNDTFIADYERAVNSLSR